MQRIMGPYRPRTVEDQQRCELAFYDSVCKQSRQFERDMDSLAVLQRRGKIGSQGSFIWNRVSIHLFQQRFGIGQNVTSFLRHEDLHSLDVRHPFRVVRCSKVRPYMGFAPFELIGAV